MSLNRVRTNAAEYFRKILHLLSHVAICAEYTEGCRKHLELKYLNMFDGPNMCVIGVSIAPISYAWLLSTKFELIFKLNHKRIEERRRRGKWKRSNEREYNYHRCGRRSSYFYPAHIEFCTAYRNIKIHVLNYNKKVIWKHNVIYIYNDSFITSKIMKPLMWNFVVFDTYDLWMYKNLSCICRQW